MRANYNGANAFSNGLQLNPAPPTPRPPDQTFRQNERRSGHFALSRLFAFDSRPSGSIFRASPETVRTGAERRPHFSLWKMRFGLHGRPRCGPFALPAMRVHERNDYFLAEG